MMWNKLTVMCFKTRRRAAITVLFWLVVTGLLSSFAPSLSSVEDNSGTSLPPAGSDSLKARDITRKAFPEQTSIPAIIVVQGEDGDAQSAAAAVERISGALTESPELKDIAGIVSSATLPQASAELVSAGGDTQLILVPINGNPSDDSFREIVQEIGSISEKNADGATVNLTGPAGIANDAVKVFSSADLTLLFATVLLVLVLLLVIYRSPAMALVPLLAAFLAMRISQGTGALMADANWFEISSQSASIMTVLLFGVGTDYALIISARYREQLVVEPNRLIAMGQAMKGVREAIVSSASTVVLGMFSLLIALTPALRGFGPYFALGVTVMALVAFTLIPSLLVLLGRVALWPAKKPRAGGGKTWEFVARMVTTAPKRVIAGTLLFLLVLSMGMFGFKGTFNLVSGFRVETQSAKGLEVIKDEFGPGRSAPTNVVIRSTDDLNAVELSRITEPLAELEEVASVDPRARISADGRVALFDVVLEYDPYTPKALDAMDSVKESVERSAREAGVSKPTVLLGGESAETADMRASLDRDNLVVAALMTAVVFITLAVLLRSLLAPVYLVATLLLSYVATLGATTFFSIQIIGDDGVSSSVPIYVFIFLVSLGVDYNIFIMSRFRQELATSAPIPAMRTAIVRTGGVVSSAGLILAATFSVLMTQPIRELFQFGFAMAFGILLDTFIIRPLLVPAIVTLLDKRALWPSKPPVS